MAEQWLKPFREVLPPMVDAEIARQRQARSKRRVRPKAPVVSRYLIGDDSTMHKPKGKKMQGMGKHHASTQEPRGVGHRLIAGLAGPATGPAAEGLGKGTDCLAEQDCLEATADPYR
ncbi:MAG TPA: hypothetical protein VGF67_14650 [Ktedonobacteraceae bacterium]|jgi:hypothetical protein